VLYDFQNNSTDGEDPGFGLVFDSAGRLYGTTTYGGSHKIGTVFQLSQKLGGNWSERIIRNFNFSADDGRYPGGELLIDTGGDLYGTTPLGGTTDGGVLFEIKPQS
jgi:uncharacterized repeat protein (TIGR03803 family)